MGILVAMQTHQIPIRVEFPPAPSHQTGLIDRHVFVVLFFFFPD